jgi:outer membrane protein OmpA-like peptidoglycan-associated protein
MAFNLMDSVKGLFTGDLMSKASASLGETEGGIGKAISGIIPAVLGTIVSKADSGIEGASSMLDMAKEAAGSGFTSQLGSLFGGGSNLLSNGLGVAQRVLGDKFSGIVNAISGFAGIKSSSVSSLAGMIAPAALGVVGTHAVENNLSPGSFANMLAAQKSSIANALPSGLTSMAGMLGLGSIATNISSLVGDRERPARPPVTSLDYRDNKPVRKFRWEIPVLLAILVIGAIWFLTRSGNHGAAAVDRISDTTAAATTMSSGLGQSIKVRLPNGIELDANKGGIEDRLVSYLNSSAPEDSIGNNRWFDFDNLNFKTARAEISPESDRQIANISTILKAYPNVRIKIGGYTDKTGNEPDNIKLSQQRAEAVETALKSKGIADQQLAGAQGYGSQYAKAAMDAPAADKQQDRRISLSVRSK